MESCEQDLTTSAQCVLCTGFQDSELLYYFIRETKLWLNINHITVYNNLAQTVYFRTQRTVIENTKVTY